MDDGIKFWDSTPWPVKSLTDSYKPITETLTEPLTKAGDSYKPITEPLTKAGDSYKALTCLECGSPLPQSAQKRKFCSTRCRNRYNTNKHRAQQPTHCTSCQKANEEFDWAAYIRDRLIKKDI
jgi:hypothetical protein